MRLNPVKTEIFEPRMTAEIPIPVVELERRPGVTELPRCLAESAGRTRARRRVLALAGLLALVVVLEIILLVRFSPREPLRIYSDAPIKFLVKP